MDSFDLINGDCLEVMSGMSENSVDSVVTDPPAGISFMGKEWDDDKGGRDHWINWMESIARECLRVLKPGGYALVWAIPRTSHWTATAWENAGFVVKDRIAHCFGSGFPKGQDIGKMIDKQAGVEREVIGFDESRLRPNRQYKSGSIGNIGGNESMSDRSDNGATITTPSTEEAKQWDGWNTCLKPAVEDWWLFQKPISESTIAKNVLKWGTGGLNIDGCRVEYVNEADKASATPQGKCTAKSGALAGGVQNDRDRESFERPELKGRYPANLIHDGSEEVIGLFPESKGQQGDVRGTELSHTGKNAYGEYGRIASEKRGDSGSAARFFYCAKASKKDRGLDNKHPTVKPTELMRYLCRLVTRPFGLILDPFMGSGSTGKAAILEGFGFIGIECEREYFDMALLRLKK